MTISLARIRHLYPEMEPIRQQQQENNLAALVEKISNVYKKFNLNNSGPLYKRGFLSGYVISSALAKYD
jgi:membrane protein insertase Oxa1/YidC/SpoIIIJ